jgi:hypothetical protein
LAAVFFAVCGAANGVAGAPFDGWAIYGSGGAVGYAEIPNAAALNPTSEITLEAWVNIQNADTNCPTIVGKGYTTNYWLGICGQSLRSYIGGVDNPVSTKQIKVPIGQWTHIAMTSDGTTRRHFIDGSLVTEVEETGTLTPNAASVRIGQDADWSVQFEGSIDEVRLWNRALATESLRKNRFYAIERNMTGLVAVWDFGAHDALGGHTGDLVGEVFGLTIPPGGCSSSTNSVCLLGRYSVSATWTTNSTSGSGVVVPPASTDTGLFWFFAPANWELMVKMIDACSFNDRVWVYIAASTDQGYVLTVRDSLTGKVKVYTKPIGPPAPAITDSAALDVCNPF